MHNCTAAKHLSASGKNDGRSQAKIWHVIVNHSDLHRRAGGMQMRGVTAGATPRSCYRASALILWAGRGPQVTPETSDRLQNRTADLLTDLCQFGILHPLWLAETGCKSHGATPLCSG
jgi:hypothetical protein